MTSQSTATESGGLSSAELALIARFLGAAAEDFADHSCNDFSLPATAENKALFLAVLEHNRLDAAAHERTPEEITAATDEVFTYDHWAMAYFARRCDGLARNPADRALAQAELFALGELLAYAYEDHERSEEHVSHDLSLPAGGEHRAILAETIKRYRTEHASYPDAYRQKVAAQLAKIAPAFLRGGEVTLPDFWVMYHLAHKCRKLSGSDKPLYDFDQAQWDADETEWAKGYAPTAADLRADELRKEVRDLARKRFRTARAAITLAGGRYLSILILAETDAERDALHGDTAFVAALGLVRKKATLQGLELQCFAFASQDAVDRRDSSVAAWWFEGVCPQIRYDEGLSAWEKAMRLGASQEILDLAKAGSGASADPGEAAAAETDETQRKGAAAFLRKHWLVVGFFAFFLAVLIFGKSTGR